MVRDSGGTLISPKQVAKAIGVSESTVKRWCDRGLIPMTKTVGGHRRLRTADVVAFITDQGYTLNSPQILGLPAGLGRRQSTIARSVPRFRQALVDNDLLIASRVLMDLVLAGHSITSLCDDIIAEAFHEIGDLWDCGDVHVYQERRSCEICMSLFRDIEGTLRPASPDAPLAVGATMAGDVYTLPVTMAGLVLKSLDWRTNLLGTNLPIDTLLQAIDDLRPRVLWLSVSHIASPATFASDINALSAKIGSIGGSLVVGGRAVTAQFRKQISVHCFADDFRALEMFARSIHHTHSDPTPPRSFGAGPVPA